MDRHRGRAIVLAGLMLLMLASGAGLGMQLEHRSGAAQPQAVAAFAPQTEDNLFAAAPPTPQPQATAHAAQGFSIEVLGRQTQTPQKRVLIYHTHTYEAYEQVEGAEYASTEKWRTADAAHNVVRVGEELAALLRALGLEVVHDVTAFEPPALSSAYTRSLDMLQARADAGERYDLYIDLHRDAYAASYTGPNTVTAGSTQVAKLMLLVGKGEGQTGEGFDQRPNWQHNLAVAQAITDALNAQADGLCRDVCIKSGRFNQHVADNCILVEAGNNRNTLTEVLCAMPYLADAIAQTLQ